MKRMQRYVIFVLGWLACSGVQADLQLSLGPEAQNLAPNTPNQPVRLLVATIGGSPMITGMQLNAFIGDGFGGADEFKFSSPAVQYEGGGEYVWDASDGSPSTDDANPSAPSVLESSYLLDAGNIPDPNGTVATLYIDTTGYSSGTFNLTLNGGDMGTGSLDETYFFLADGTRGIPSYPGVLAITAVPEPSAVWGMGCVAMLSAGITVYRRMRERLHCAAR